MVLTERGLYGNLFGRELALGNGIQVSGDHLAITEITTKHTN